MNRSQLRNPLSALTSLLLLGGVTSACTADFELGTRSESTSLLSDAYSEECIETREPWWPPAEQAACFGPCPRVETLQLTETMRPAEIIAMADGGVTVRFGLNTLGLGDPDFEVLPDIDGASSFLTRFDAEGERVFSLSFKGVEGFSRITSTRDDRVLLASNIQTGENPGLYLIQIDLQGDVEVLRVLNHNIEPSSFERTPQGGYILAGRSNDSGELDGFLIEGEFVLHLDSELRATSVESSRTEYVQKILHGADSTVFLGEVTDSALTTKVHTNSGSLYQAGPDARVPWVGVSKTSGDLASGLIEPVLPLPDYYYSRAFGFYNSTSSPSLLSCEYAFAGLNEPADRSCGMVIRTLSEDATWGRANRIGEVALIPQSITTQAVGNTVFVLGYPSGTLAALAPSDPTDLPSSADPEAASVMALDVTTGEIQWIQQGAFPTISVVDARGRLVVAGHYSRNGCAERDGEMQAVNEYKPWISWLTLDN